MKCLIYGVREEEEVSVSPTNILLNISGKSKLVGFAKGCSVRILQLPANPQGICIQSCPYSHGERGIGAHTLWVTFINT